MLATGKPAVPATTRRYRPPVPEIRGPALALLPDGGVTCLRRGVYPHPKDCSKFLVCVPSVASSELDGFIHDCPQDTYFMEHKSRCMPGDRKKCDSPQWDRATNSNDIMKRTEYSDGTGAQSFPFTSVHSHVTLRTMKANVPQTHSQWNFAFLFAGIWNANKTIWNVYMCHMVISSFNLNYHNAAIPAPLNAMYKDMVLNLRFVDTIISPSSFKIGRNDGYSMSNLWTLLHCCMNLELKTTPFSLVEALYYLNCMIAVGCAASIMSIF